jgi:hypothetical protein
MNIKIRPYVFCVAAALALATLLPAGLAAAAGGGGGGGGHGGMGIGGGFGGAGNGGMNLGSGVGGGHGGMGIGGGFGGLGNSRGGMGMGGGDGHGGMGIGAGFGGTGNGAMHLGGRGNLGGTGNFGDNFGHGTLGLGHDGNLSAPGAAVSPLGPDVQHFDARMGLKPWRADDASEGIASDGSGNAKAVGKSDKEREGSAAEIEEQELQLEQAQQLDSTPMTPSPPGVVAAATTGPGIAAAATTGPTATPAIRTPQTAPSVATGATSSSSDLGAIGAYFAGHGAPVASVPASSVAVSVGGVLPSSVALFAPPADLASQISDPDFLYFVWGQNVVVVDAETNVVNGIIPDVLAHQD